MKERPKHSTSLHDFLVAATTCGAVVYSLFSLCLNFFHCFVYEADDRYFVVFVIAYVLRSLVAIGSQTTQQQQRQRQHHQNGYKNNNNNNFYVRNPKENNSEHTRASQSMLL